MNNKIKLSVIILMAFAFSAIVIFNLKKVERLFAEQNEIKNDAEDERQEIAGATNWWNNMRANQITHAIDILDVQNALRDADENLSKGSRALSLVWEEMGPDNSGGRARSLLFDKANPNHIFGGGVSGGLWESQNLGQSWNHVNGFNDATIWNNQNISSMTQTADGNIYVGTGEYFGWFTTSVVSGGTGFPGDGIWKSANHGATWTHVKTSGSTNPSTSNAWSFVTNLASGGNLFPNRVYASIKGGGTTSGIQYSDDGITWANCTNGTAVLIGLGSDVEVSPNGSVHAIVGNKYYHSLNGVSDFTNTGITGLPSSASVNRMACAVSPTNSNYIYVIATYGTSTGDLLKGVYKSTDGGMIFTQIAPQQTSNVSVNWSPITQGTYALALSVSPADENVVFMGGLDSYKYQLQTNGNYAWDKISRWTYPPWYSLYVHADIHAFIFHPTNPEIMFVASDGGFSMSTNSSGHQPTFGTRNLGFNVTQFYSCDAREYSGVFVAGAQDNGNFRVDFSGNTTKTGVEIKGGDGGDVQVSKVNPNAIFAEYVNGSVERSSNDGQSFLGMFDTHIDAGPSGTPDGEPDAGAAFISPILLYENVALASDLNKYSKFFLGTYNGVWMTQQAMNFSVTPTWFKLSKTTISGVVISLAITPDGKSLFVGTEEGRLYRIDGLDTTYAYDSLNVFSPDNIGITTTLINSFGSRYITGITVDKTNSNHVIAVLGNYGNTDYVYESNNALTSATFTSITGTGLPKMPVYCSAIDPTDANTIIIGTELGIWATENGGSSWSEQNNTMARVPVTKLRQLPVGNYLNTIYASTYGNGIWRTFSNSAVSTQEPQNISSEIKLFPNPASDEITFISQLSWGSTNVSASLIDINGRLVRTINYGKMGMGVYNLKFSLNDIAVGNYLFQVISGNKQTISKIIVAH